MNETEEKDDIFSGISVSSNIQQQSQLSNSQFPRLKESHAITSKSVMGGISTAESGARQQEESKEVPPTPPKEKGNNNARLFLPDRGYGVINVQKSHDSPTGSVTSDITSSVIFERDTMRPGQSSFRRQLDILETTDEAANEMSLSPSTKAQSTNPSLPKQDVFPPPIECELIEPKKSPTSQHQESCSPTENEAVNREVSLISPSTNDTVTHPSNTSSFMKKARSLASKAGSDKLSTTAGTAGNETATAASALQSRFSDGNTVSVNTMKSSSFLSQFGCGVFSSSSFAFCAPPQPPGE
jgi:hypothetical protein